MLHEFHPNQNKYFKEREGKERATLEKSILSRGTAYGEAGGTPAFPELREASLREPMADGRWPMAEEQGREPGGSAGQVQAEV